MKNSKPIRRPRHEIVAEIEKHKGTVPTYETLGCLPTRRDLTEALDAARKRSKLIGRAVHADRSAATLKARVDATRPKPSTRPAPDVHPAIAREAALDRAWRQYQECETQLERRRIYDQHKQLFTDAAVIHRASALAQSQSQNS